MSAHIQQNRLLKASRFAEFLDKHLEDQATAFAIGELTTSQWERITDIINQANQYLAEQQEDASDLPRGTIVYKVETVPSFETRALIVNWFHLRETRPSNVFDCFR